MKKIIFNLDNFIMNCIEKVAKATDKNNIFIIILGAFLLQIFLIVFAIPIIILHIFYLFIDRDKLFKEYEKGAKK